MRTRVLVADDNRLYSEAVAALLESDPRIAVVGCAANGAEAADFAAKLEPDIVLMDIRMPVMDGIEATRRIVTRRPEAKVLVVTAYGSPEEFELAFTAGAVGCVSKDDVGLRLVDLVFEFARGEPSEVAASFAATALPYA